MVRVGTSLCDVGAISLGHVAQMALLLACLGTNNARAQATVQLTTKPAVTWGDAGGYSGYMSSGALLTARNDAYQTYFNKCKATNQAQAPHAYECARLEMTGIRPVSSVPAKINGDYTYFGINATWHYEGVTAGLQPSSRTADASNNYSMQRSVSCARTHNLNAVLVAIDPNENEMTCVRYQAAPQQDDRPKSCPSTSPGKRAGNGSPGSGGNPITFAGGKKTEVQLDYISANGLLQLERRLLGQATGWRLPGDNEIADLFSGQTESTSYLWENDIGSTIDAETGATVTFPIVLEFPVIKSSAAGEVYRLNGDGSVTPYRPNASNVFPVGIDGDLLTRIEPIEADETAWRWRRANNVVDDYGFDGRLRKKFWPDGKVVVYSYSGGNLGSISDPWGRQVIVTVGANNRIDQIQLPDGATIHYGYVGKQLQSVQFADATSKSFLYSEPTLSLNTYLAAALTGIIDEKGKRIGTYRYNSSGVATSTEGANGVNKYSVQLNSTYTTVTPPIGEPYYVYYSVVNNAVVKTSQTQAAGSGCPASSMSLTYDSNANITSAVDFAGRLSCYGYDLSRNIESARVEGLGTSAQCNALVGPNVTLPTGSRKVSSEWHPDWRMSTRVAEPGHITTSIYNGQPDPFSGNALASCAPASALLPDGKPIAVLCKQVEQATTDADGHLGFSAGLQSGVADRVSSWTYNQYGQVLTEDGPRTDVSDITTYTYYSDTTADHTMGDLQSVTNAAGKVTSFSKYNKHGQLLESTDPNGVLTVNTYDLRQRLLSNTVGGQTTSYSYDPVGQLKKVTLPDTSWVGYDYDDAHRQVAVYDNKGNRTEYVLDNAGNRTGETTKDPNGALKRQLSRSIDALGRVQQTTGRE